MWYALSQTFVTRGDNGETQPNYSHLLGNFATAGISNVYRAPSDRTFDLTMRDALIVTAGNAVGNILREFISVRSRRMCRSSRMARKATKPRNDGEIRAVKGGGQATICDARPTFDACDGRYKGRRPFCKATFSPLKRSIVKTHKTLTHRMCWMIERASGSTDLDSCSISLQVDSIADYRNVEESTGGSCCSCARVADPPGMLAQLPDAPMPADSVQGAGNSASDRIAIQNNLEAGVGGPGGSDDGGNAGYAEPGVSSSVARAQDVAFVEPDDLDAQQSFAPSPKRRLQPTYSSSTAYLGEVRRGAGVARSCPMNRVRYIQLDMCCHPIASPFSQYLKWPDVVPLTARDNLRSAVRGVIDPFNLMTIAGDAAIGIGSDSHTAYGPGFDGFSKYAGVSLTEDMTGEFFGTFLIPSVMHQDPHYHREPFMPIKHRILHAIVQVVWSQSYTGKPMFNYANIVGGIATAVVSNTFVPGPNRQGFGNTAQRLALAFAISPSGNFIEEFVPDLASHVNFRVVIFQRILNTVTLEESGVTQ